MSAWISFERFREGTMNCRLCKYCFKNEWTLENKLEMVYGHPLEKVHSLTSIDLISEI